MNTSYRFITLLKGFTVVLLYSVTVFAAKPDTCEQSLMSPFDEHSIIIRDAWISFTEKEVEEATKALWKLDRRHNVQASFILNENDLMEVWELNQKLPGSVMEKLKKLAIDFKNIYKEAKGTSPNRVQLSIRLTSNTVGHSVRPDAFYKVPESGLHDHWKESSKDDIDILWTLKGQGSRVLKDGMVESIGTNKVVLFGSKVKHGSPDTNDLRLLIVGGAR